MFQPGLSASCGHFGMKGRKTRQRVKCKVSLNTYNYHIYFTVEFFLLLKGCHAVLSHHMATTSSPRGTYLKDHNMSGPLNKLDRMIMQNNNTAMMRYINK